MNIAPENITVTPAPVEEPHPFPKGNARMSAAAVVSGYMDIAKAADAAGITVAELRDLLRSGSPSERARRSMLGASAWHALRQSRHLIDNGDRARALVETARERGVAWEAIAEPFDLAPDTLRKKLREAGQ
ncbi:hypothetical protein CMP1-63 [Clavibacter phage CMP1]|uniref:Uncharacterized protein n=1 Tax=Clavibacter phage CMP1 TaxID=686439 RepID=D0U247_9CAUD|nr:hypothetical protein CMP1-63 [Clavibacter phage CMP1]ACY35955.1 hypothetical protein CMP1-63 [Clavibacter phage CMP1]